LLLASVLLVKFVHQDKFNNHFTQGNRISKTQIETTGQPDQKETQENAVAVTAKQNAAAKKESQGTNKTPNHFAGAIPNPTSANTGAVPNNNALPATDRIATTNAPGNKSPKLPRQATTTVPPQKNKQLAEKDVPRHTFQRLNQNGPETYWAGQQAGTGKQTIIAVGGGVNYGSLNAGYSIGITAQHKLGNNFFVDGTIAMMYNNNINNAGNYAGQAPAFASRPASFIAAAPSKTFTPTQNLYYLQFNPSFGYEIGNKIAISMGGDVQQMISDDQYVDKVQVYPDGVRVFPTLDLGITGKTEFNVTPHIRAGIIFREGLNNFLMSNSPTQYVNRRYFQVQFKYAIPVQ